MAAGGVDQPIEIDTTNAGHGIGAFQAAADIGRTQDTSARVQDVGGGGAVEADCHVGALQTSDDGIGAEHAADGGVGIWLGVV